MTMLNWETQMIFKKNQTLFFGIMILWTSWILVVAGTSYTFTGSLIAAGKHTKEDNLDKEHPKNAINSTRQCLFDAQNEKKKTDNEHLLINTISICLIMIFHNTWKCTSIIHSINQWNMIAKHDKMKTDIKQTWFWQNEQNLLNVAKFSMTRLRLNKEHYCIAQETSVQIV